MDDKFTKQVIECSCKDNINIDNIFKAYLSLAKVSLSTSVVPTNLNSRTNAATITGLSPSSRTLSPTEQIISTPEEWLVSIVTHKQINNTCTSILSSTLNFVFPFLYYLNIDVWVWTTTGIFICICSWFRFCFCIRLYITSNPIQTHHYFYF